MKSVLPLILACLLLCGCSRESIPEETILPSASVAEDMQEPEQYGGAVQTFPLTLQKVRSFRAVGDQLLLFSGQGSTTLTLADRESFEELATVTLDFQLEPEDPSLRLHPDGRISFFDPDQEETVVLDASLKELRRIDAPGSLTGQPILSDNGKTLYYCTASDVRAWDLESGIHRCVKEMAFESQYLTDVLLNGAVLQCLVTDGGMERTRFFSSENGRLLFEGPGDYSVITEADCFYASVPAGTYRVQVFGEYNQPPQMLVPSDLGAEVFFLPQQEGAVSARSLEDDRVLLEYYDLPTGRRTGALPLDPLQLPASVESIGGSLYILTYDPARDQELILRWDMADAPQDDTCYREPYYPAGAPDTAGLADCQKQAEELSRRFGIQILLWEEAAAVSGAYAFTPEHLVPVIRQELRLLEQRLSQYPQGMLEQTAAHFDRLKLCLVRSVSGSPEGEPGAHFLSGTEAYVAVPTGSFGEQALHHGLFHAMETHIFGESTAFDRWDALNPAGFQYDYDYAANALRDSGVYLFQENRAFVDTYSMSFPKEDRARIMEYATLPGNESLFQSQTMQAKLQKLCTGIREAYGLKKSEETYIWEQYLDR